jgi:hypothetical protein
MRRAVVDADVGALVTVVLSVIPLSPIGGGAVAANRHGGGYASGVWLGLLTGVGAAVPLLALFVPALYIASALGFGISPSSPAYEPFLVIVFALFSLYTVGLSVFGGLIGTWASAHTDWELDPGRWL